MSFKPSDDAIQMLMRQVELTTENARDLLIKYNGNILKALEAAMDNTPQEQKNGDEEKENIDISENGLDPHKRIKQFRQILDEKDKIFMEHVRKEYDEERDLVRDFEFVAWKSDTTIFKKDTVKCTVDSFINNTLKPFIRGITTNQTETSETTPKQEFLKMYVDRIEIKNLKHDSNAMLAKWKFFECSVAYKKQNIHQFEDTLVNVLGTKLLRKSNIISETEYYSGSIVVIHNWKHE